MSPNELAALRSEAGRAAFLSRVQAALAPEDYRVIEAMAEALALLEKEPTNLRKLQHLIFGPKSEHTERICPKETPAAPPPRPRGRRKGHGRIRARDFTGAHWNQVDHPRLRAGEPCPSCGRGRLRMQRNPARLLRIEGSPPIAATGFMLERLRCDACGEVFTAPAPPEAGQEKYAPSVAVTIALLRYGTGVPHHRLARLQRDLGVPLP
jgi:transposase